MGGEGRETDIVIFGSSGFTGKHVVFETVKWLNSISTSNKQSEGKGKEKANKAKLSWGVAGRSIDKLNEVLLAAKNNTGYDTKNVKRYKADVNDQASLNAMAAKCKVVLNCVGPYRFFGEQVVKACVEEGTNYVDVSGEPEFLESMQLKYHEEAEKKGIHIIGACGFDSIPTDCGVTLLQSLFNQAGGEMNSVESYIDVSGKFKINHATWLSAIYGVANARNLSAIRKALYKGERPLLPWTHKLEYKGAIHYNKAKPIDGYYLPFPGSDISVVKRSQRYLYSKKQWRPVQISAYFQVGSPIKAVLMLCFAFIFGLLAQFRLGQNFLDKWASWITLGYVTKEGPKDDEMHNVKFNIHLVGKGWQNKLSGPDDKHLDNPDMTKVLKVSGTNPGYGATCVILLQSALTIIDEKDKLPSTGGVYPPGAAFADTTLVHRLNENGVKFEEVSISQI